MKKVIGVLIFTLSLILLSPNTVQATNSYMCAWTGIQCYTDISGATGEYGCQEGYGHCDSNDANCKICESITNQSECTGQNPRACIYQNPITTCSQISESTDCNKVAGCKWFNNSCNPSTSATSCSQITDQFDCNSYKNIGCQWTSNSCQTIQSIGGSSTNTTSFSDFADDFNDTIGINPELGTIGGIISALLPWLLVIAGLILFIMLISGGFTLMTAASNPDNAEKGKARLTGAITGFIIIFASYWIIQILEIILGITILGN